MGWHMCAIWHHGLSHGVGWEPHAAPWDLQWSGVSTAWGTTVAHGVSRGVRQLPHEVSHEKRATIEVAFFYFFFVLNDGAP